MLKNQFIVLCLVLLSSTQLLADQNSEFWDWFQKNEAHYFEFSFDDTKQRDRLFDLLGKQLHDIDENLTFEIGQLSESKRDLVISAGGIVSSFPKVIQLVDAAPALTRWKITAFRQPNADIATIEMAGLEINGENTVVQLYKDGERIGVVLYMPGYQKTPDHVYEQIGFLLLDQTLGEYTVGTRVGFVEFEPYKSGLKDSFKLRELPRFFSK